MEVIRNPGIGGGFAYLVSTQNQIETRVSTSSIACESVILNQGFRVVEVVRGHGGPPPKSLDSDENFKPEHTLFCCELRLVAIYGLLLRDLWA